jgi:hypothetical protein
MDQWVVTVSKAQQVEAQGQLLTAQPGRPKSGILVSFADFGLRL